MTTTQIWTGILVICLILFMTTQTMLKMKRRNRVLPALLKMSRGPFASTRMGSEGIILPSLVYRNESHLSRRMLRKRQKLQHKLRKVETKDPADLGREEILNVAKLLENEVDDCKLIHEERNVSGHVEGDQSLFEETQGHAEVKEVCSGLFSPLEAAYEASKMVTEVWASPQSGVTSLYRYTHLDRLVYPPGYLFRRDFSFA